MSVNTLILGSMCLVNGMRDPNEREPVVLLDVPDSAVRAGRNSLLLDLTSKEPVAFRVIGLQGEVAKEGDSALADAVRARGASAALSETMGAHLHSATPLFMRRAGARTAGTYSILRIGDRDALFVRTGDDETDASLNSPDERLTWLSRARELHARDALVLNNHGCYYRKLFAGREVEMKFTFDQDVDIWGLATGVHNAVAQGRLEGFIPEYADEFQAWDYPTRLFELLGDESEVGYVAFIPMTTGKWVVKRKTYARDSFIRGESIKNSTEIEGTLEDFVRSQISKQFRKLPALRRVRYDLNLESLETGHVFGIFFDCVSVIGAEAVKMYQCEVEYLRTRSVLPSNEDVILGEFRKVEDFAQQFIQRRGLKATPGYYSKLSFLRDSLASSRIKGEPAPHVLP